MSLKDNLAKIAGKAKDVVDKSGDKIASGVDKATDFADKKTGGKHHDKLEKLDNLAAKLDKKSGAAAAGADTAVNDAADTATDTAAPIAPATTDPTPTGAATPTASGAATPTADAPPEFPTPQP